MTDRALRILGPAIVGLLFLSAWEAVVRYFEIPWYVLPGPVVVAETLWRDGPSLLASLWVTVRITLAAFVAAILLGGAIAILFAQSRVLEQSFLPYAIALQVTPVVAIAPLIIIWVNNAYWSVLILALIVAFFPIVANTTLGLNSADRNLAALFKLYGATRWQALRYLRMPTALPNFLAGVKISGGLALVGAVVAELVAGTGGSETGLAYRILEAGYRLEIARQMAALVLLALTGMAIYFSLDRVSRWLLSHWHESALPDEE